jgi:hypothetical protein
MSDIVTRVERAGKINLYKHNNENKAEKNITFLKIATSRTTNKQTKTAQTV